MHQTFSHLFVMQDLKSLNLAYNFISSLTIKSFNMLAKLKSLDISGNPLDELQPEVFKDITV